MRDDLNLVMTVLPSAIGLEQCMLSTWVVRGASTAYGIMLVMLTLPWKHPHFATVVSRSLRLLHFDLYLGVISV